MGKKTNILLAGLLLGVSVIVAWTFFSQREPTYHGKTLTHWLQVYYYAATYYDETNNSQKLKEADDEISRIGTNAVPFLLKKLSVKDSALWTSAAALIRKRTPITIEITTAEDRDMQAFYGFGVLESNAAFAVPQLETVYATCPHPYSREVVVAILGTIGPAAEDSVPILLKAVNDTNILVRNNAIWALGQIQARPSQVVPVLIGLLSDSNGYVRAQAAASLGEFGEIAKPAVPALRELLWSERAKPKTSMTVASEVDFSFRPGLGPTRGGYPADVVTPVEGALKILDR